LVLFFFCSCPSTRPFSCCPLSFSVVLACSRLSSPVVGCPRLLSVVLAHSCPSVKQSTIHANTNKTTCTHGFPLLTAEELALFFLRSCPFTRPFLCSSRPFSRSSCPSVKQSTIHANITHTLNTNKTHTYKTKHIHTIRNTKQHVLTVPSTYKLAPYFLCSCLFLAVLAHCR
jgi:hypothetical protein